MLDSDANTAKTLTLVAIILQVVFFVIGIFAVAALSLITAGVTTTTSPGGTVTTTAPVGVGIFGAVFGGIFLIGLLWILLDYFLIYKKLAEDKVEEAETPALVLGIFWKRANKWGATLGMIGGLGITFYYMTQTQPWLRGLFGVTKPMADAIWWDINPISAGMFGVPLGFVIIIVVSLLTPAPEKDTQELVEHVRYPHLRGDINTQAT